ncbi:ABC transporter ATP-binding protein [Psychromarinibacter sp. C21-152]|uniref:ABC transporter ATP-binding protein n=1 Tax=Psychromarinibacter sediminicola TaxID=3033385 RepID=A0AAE3T743_9RHOB|nr:ABC transporter ATP-binding protein [Psychromarinibacter sediminicola]MDF0599932.1 ABC transporter ATP-binding protein [Psychromarinibacter sediminicola]
MSEARDLTRWLWQRYLRRHLWVIVLAVVLMAIEGGMMGALSYLIKPMFDQVFVAGNRGAITWVAGAVFGVFLIRALAGFGQRVLMRAVGQWVSAALQGDLVAHMLRLDSAWFQAHSPGVLIERVRGDTLAAGTIWSTVFSALGRDVVALLSLFAVALSIDWIWTLIAVAGAPVLMGPMVLLQRWVRRSTRVARQTAARLSTRLDETFHGIDTIKLNTIEGREADRFSGELGGFVGAQIRSEAGQAGIPAVMDVIAGIGFFGVLLYGGAQIIDGEKTVGEFMSFFTAMALVFEPLRRIGNVSGAWQAALASLERLHEVFQAEPTITTPAEPAALPVPARRAEVRLDDVSLAYGELPVLRGASFVAEAGRTTALVGASGAGKSTVFRVLTRLVEPQSGSARVGGVDVSALSLEELRGLFSVVTQDAQLFDESVRDNILLGQPADAARLDEVLHAAHVADFLPRLADGLDSPAGPRGSALSGGQRQRVAIARALLRDAPILLLDEATSALDAASEAVVQEALERLSQGRTTLVIAHRLATIRQADKIVVMDQGTVVDEGTHEALIARGGIYADLYRLQFEE